MTLYHVTIARDTAVSIPRRVVVINTRYVTNVMLRVLMDHFRFLLGLFNGMMAAAKTLVPIVCGKEHETVGMGVVSSELSR